MTDKKSKKLELHQQTKLYKLLEKRNEHEAISMIDKFVALASNYLNLVGGAAFSSFTLHNDKHSLNLLNYAGNIIPEDTQKKLSTLEVLILVYSFYFHDIGMAISYAKHEEIRKSDGFIIFLSAHPEFSDKIAELYKKRQSCCESEHSIIDMRIADLYHAALTDYIRPKHAKKESYNQFVADLEDDRKALFEYKGESFLDELILICHSHNERTIVLAEQDEDGKKIFNPDYMLSNERLNLQYCAMILRLCDILDFDRERTPKLLYRAIGIEDKKVPGFKISLEEWQKQMDAHTIKIEKDCIKVHARCKSPNIERAIRNMSTDVEREIRDTLQILNENKKSITDIYKIALPLMVIPMITPQGYVYKDYSIKLNESAVVKLLMGENLYPNPKVAVRELLQNSIDACFVRQGKEHTYIPHVEVSFEADDEHVWLVVKDDGIGMDEYVLSNYFLKIGKSYYSSSDFKTMIGEKDFTSFNPISRFGIGFLSVFMVGDYVKVYTRNKFSKTNPNGSVLMVDGTESLAIFQKDNTLEQGTTIKVQLKQKYKNEEYLRGLVGYIKETFIRPAIPIRIQHDGAETILKDSSKLMLKGTEEYRLLNEGVCPVRIDLGKYSNDISGVAYFFFFRDEGGKLYHQDIKNMRVWDMDTLKIGRLFDNLECLNLVTVNGIKMTVSKIGKLFNVKRNIMPYVVDVNISSSSKIVFDVARQKLIGEGLDYVRCMIIDVIVKALKEEHIYEQLAEETQKKFRNARIRFSKLEPLEPNLLAEIEKCCPEGDILVDSALVKSVSMDVSVDTEVARHYLLAIRDLRRKKM